MRTINTTFGTFGASVLLLGLKGDSNATEILIDCAEALEEYQGTMAAMSITGPDDTVYPGDISLDENGIVHWVVAARDCGIAGNGSARVDLVDDEGTVVASAEARTIIMKTNMQGVAPDQIANWTEAASVALQEARAALLDLIDTDTTATTNEAARQLAETGRVSAETLRASAETARASAETARATAENTRASAESTRIAAENTRASAENTRIAAEAARVSEFSTIEANAQAALSYIGPSEASSTASAAHAAGSYFIYNGKLYQATADIAIGDTITSGTNCAKVPGGAMGEVSNLKSAITYEKDHASLTTYLNSLSENKSWWNGKWANNAKAWAITTPVIFPYPITVHACLDVKYGISGIRVYAFSSPTDTSPTYTEYMTNIVTIPANIYFSVVFFTNLSSMPDDAVERIVYSCGYFDSDIPFVIDDDYFGRFGLYQKNRVDVSYRVSSKYIEYTPKQIKISMQTGYVVNILYFENTVYISATGFVSEAVIPSGSSFKLSVEKDPADPTETADIATYVAAVTISDYDNTNARITVLEEKANTFDGQIDFIDNGTNYFSQSDFVVGGLYDGRLQPQQKYAISFSDIHTAENDFYVVAGEEFEFNVHKFTSGTFSEASGWKTVYKISKGQQYKICLKKIDTDVNETTTVSARYQGITAQSVSYFLNGNYYHPILKNEWDEKVEISDGFKYKCGDGAQVACDEDTAIVYCVYNTSETYYGESKDTLALSVFPIKQPFAAEHFVVMKTGVQYGSYTFSTFQDENILMMDDAVRIFFDGVPTGESERQWVYVDFDKATHTFSNPTPVLFKYPSGSTTYALNATNMSAYLTSAGKTVQTDYWPTISANFQEYNDKLYSVISGGSASSSGYKAYPCVAFTTDNGATWEITGVIQYECIFECQIAILSETMYVMLRTNNNDTHKMVVSTDGGETFSDMPFFIIGNTRPQMRAYKDKIITFTTLYNELWLGEPLSTEFSDEIARAGFVLRMGTGTDMYDYKRIAKIYDPHGLLYYAVFTFHDDLYMCACSGDLFWDKTNTRKDAVYFARIGEITDGVLS